MTDLREMVRQHPSGQPHLTILSGYVSTQRPAPSSPSDPLWVIVPAHGASTPYGPLSWPLSHGAAIPVQGTKVVLGMDDNGTPAVLSWAGPNLSTGSFDVRSFGVTGGGVVDDTAAFQSALNKCAGQGVFVPGGTYLTSAALVVPANTSVWGQGLGSLIKVGGPAHTLGSIDGFQIVNASGASVRNVQVVGPEDGTMNTADGPNAGHGILVDASNNVTIEDVFVSRFNIQGILLGLTGACSACRVERALVTQIWGGNGISVDFASSDIQIIDPICVSIADSAVGVHNGCTRIQISNPNITTTKFGRGIDLYGTGEAVSVTGGVIKNAGQHGIWVSSPGTSGTPATVNATKISDITIIGSGGDGIQVWGESDGLASHDIYYATINNATVLGSTNVGIRIGRGCFDTRVNGGVVSSSGSHGISAEEFSTFYPLRTGVTGVTVIGNGGWGVIGSTNSTGRLTGNSLEGNTSGKTSVPGAWNTAFQN